MEFHEKIASARKKKGWTQGELADLIGVAAGLMGKYERAEVTPPLGVAASLAEVLDSSLDYLVGLTEENPTKSADTIPGKLKPLLAKLEQLSPADRNVIGIVIDGLIAKAKQ